MDLMKEYIRYGKPKVAVIGCGGMGINTIHRMVVDTFTLKSAADIDLISMDTDAKHLLTVLAGKKILLGKEITKGEQTSGHIELGRAATEHSTPEIRETIGHPDIAFIIAGMGGGTGTASAPIVADIAKRRGAFTIGIFTKPFRAEGENRRRMAEEWIEEASKYTDILVLIDNENLLSSANPEKTIGEAFSAIQARIESIITGIINEYSEKPVYAPIDKRITAKT